MNPPVSSITNPNTDMAVWASVSHWSMRIAIGGTCVILICIGTVVWGLIEEATRTPIVPGVVEHDISTWSILGGAGVFGVLLGAALRWIAKREYIKASQACCESPGSDVDH